MAINQFVRVLEEKIAQYPSVDGCIIIDVVTENRIWVTFLQRKHMWIDFHGDSIMVFPMNILLEREHFGIADIDRAADYVIELLDCERIENFRLSWFIRWQLSKYRELTIFFATAVVYFAIMSLMTDLSYMVIIVPGLLLVPLMSFMLMSETDAGDMTNLYELAIKLHQRYDTIRATKILPLPIALEIIGCLKFKC